MAETRKSFSCKLLRVPAFLLLLLLTGCAQQLYANPEEPNYGIMKEALENNRHYNPRRNDYNFSPVVVGLLAKSGSSIQQYGISLLAFDLLVKKAAGSLKRNDIMKASEQELAGCSPLPVEKRVLRCFLYGSVWPYLHHKPTPDRKRIILSRRYLLIDIYLRYPDMNPSSDPESVYMDSTELFDNTTTEQYEYGIETN